MSNLKQDERDDLEGRVSNIFQFDGDQFADESKELVRYILANYTLKTEATAAQERAVAEAEESVVFAVVSTPTEGIIDKGDVFIKQESVKQTMVNIVGYEKFKAMQEAADAPQNRGEG